jgi:hypothetical protein
MAERSRQLWATINVCDPSNRRGTVGVRAQIPALGFAARLGMTFRLQYLDPTSRRFIAVPGVSRTMWFGRFGSRGVLQDGIEYQFAGPVTLRAQVTFTWQRSGRTLGTAGRLSQGHVTNVRDADPAGYSRATCTIPAHPVTPPGTTARNRRGSLEITPVTPIASSRPIRAGSSTVHT